MPKRAAPVKAVSVSSDRLKSFVERIEKLEEEKKAIAGDLKEVYAEAKDVGYDVGTIRWAIKERALDAGKRAERDTLRDTYGHALGIQLNLFEQAAD